MRFFVRFDLKLTVITHKVNFTLPTATTKSSKGMRRLLVVVKWCRCSGGARRFSKKNRLYRPISTDSLSSYDF